MTAIEKCPELVEKIGPLSSPQPELRRLTVLETETQITIAGRVSSFFLKSMALEAAKILAEGREVVLHIEVGD